MVDPQPERPQRPYSVAERQVEYPLGDPTQLENQQLSSPLATEIAASGSISETSSTETPSIDNSAAGLDSESPRTRLLLTILVFVITTCAYYLLQAANLNGSAALYVGLPLLLALGLALSRPAKTAVGSTLKGLTIALLLLAPLLREGYICILFAAPVFYSIGLSIAFKIDRQKERAKRLETAALATFFAILALEGTTPTTSFSRYNLVSVTKILTANINDVRQQLAQTPQFDRHKPWFLKIFPNPVAATGSGLAVGAERQLHFVTYKHIWWTKVEGDLRLKIVSSNPQYLKFEIVHDDSYLSHYLTWKTSEVSLTPIDDRHTVVTWTLTYHRNLDPFWYFGPLQSYAVQLTAQELIDDVATPITAREQLDF